jgi:hypothetical protein
MILAENLESKVETNKDLETTNFRIDPSYMNKMIWLTINQYEFKIRTPVQEIISNARDAHREVGKIAPIKLTLPTQIDPTFKVRDYGTGLTPKMMKEIFTSFGASTKSNSNDQTGGFGIGAKSPLTYTDQYNVSTYVDGKVWHYAVIKGADSGIELKLLMQGITSEENGTELQIPVKKGDTKEFIEAACRCTMFWDVQPIFNLDDTRLYKAKNVIDLGDNVELYRKGDLGNLFNSAMITVIDGIPYELDRYKMNLDYIRGFSGTAIFKFNTGDIKILQTREALDQNDKNRDALNGAMKTFETNIEKFKENVLDKSSLISFITSYKSYNRVLNLGYEKYKGYRLNGSNASIDNLTIERYGYKGRSGQTVKAMQKSTSKYISLEDNTLVLFDDVRDKESHVIKRRRIKNALKTYREVFLVKASTNTLQKNRAISLRNFYVDFKGFYKKLSEIEQLIPEKKVRTTTKNGVKRTVVDFCVLELGRYGQSSIWHKSDSFPTDVKYVYVKKVGNGLPHIDRKVKYYIESLKGTKLIAVSPKSLKIIKDLDNVQSIKDFTSEMKPTERQIIDRFHFDRLDRRSTQFLVKNRSKILNRTLRNLVYKLGKIDSSNRKCTDFPSDIIQDTIEYKKLSTVLGYLKRTHRGDIRILEDTRTLGDSIRLDFINRRK